MVRYPEDYGAVEQVIAPDGSYDEEAVASMDLDDRTLRSMYETMIRSRAIEERGMTLQRGRTMEDVSLLENNQWAISVPVDRQTGAETYADRAAGYGFDGVLVDGNDVLATYRATKRAVEYARTEGEPTLIGALTYRRGAHSTSDDPSLYRDESPRDG